MFPLRNIKRFLAKSMRQPGYALRVARSRVLAYTAYRYGRGRAFAPEAITLFLTRMCNLRCKMCGQWGDYGVSRGQEARGLGDYLKLDEIKMVLDEIKAFHPGITLFGGEPLMHPQAVEIIRYVKQLRLHCLIITNGAMLERLAGDMVEAGLDELNISLDGDAALHDEIRGLPGVFDKIMSGIAAVNAAKAKIKKSKPLINLQCTISRYNYAYLEKLLDAAETAQANSLTFHNLIFLKKELLARQKEYDAVLGCSSGAWEGFVFDPGIDPAKLYEKMQEILSRPRNFSVDFYPNFSRQGLAQYYQNPDYLPLEYSPRCLSPWLCAYVFPDGEVRPCLNSTYSFGNLKKEKFLKAWNSPAAVLYRNKLKKEGIFPACRRCTELYRY